jgi:hypothetical protein
VTAAEEFLADPAAIGAWLDGQRREGTTRRAENMARLLTELSYPAAVARLIQDDLAAERRLFRELLDRVDAGEPGSRTTQRELVTAALAANDADRARCAARLAARKTDVEIGLKARSPDPEEEPDVGVRMWASQIRERIDSTEMALGMRKSANEHNAKAAEWQAKMW